MTDSNATFLEAYTLEGRQCPWRDLVIAVYLGESNPDAWLVGLRKSPTATPLPNRGSATALSMGMSEPSASHREAEVPDAS